MPLEVFGEAPSLLFGGKHKSREPNQRPSRELALKAQGAQVAEVAGTWGVSLAEGSKGHFSPQSPRACGAPLSVARRLGF
jgi:hypothetical protein